MIKIILPLVIIALFTAITTIVIIASSWSVITMLFAFLNIFVLVISLRTWSKNYKFWQQKSIKKGVIVLIKTTLILLAISVINLFAIRYNVSKSFTENQPYALSSQSQEVVKKLKKPLKILIFDRELNPNLESLLEKYQRINKQFQYQVINPDQELKLARQYKIQSLGEIYLQYDNKKQRLNFRNASVGKAVTEAQLTNSIEKIQTDRITNIYLLQGHGEASNQLVERGIAQIVVNLEDKGNMVKEMNLASEGKIPDDADLIVIAGATRKLLAGEVSSLQEYLSAGGNLLLLLPPNTNLGITPLLEEWGVKLDNRLVVDGSNAGNAMGFGPGVAIVNTYGDHSITANFGNGIAIFPESRPIKVIKKPEVESIPLVITNEQTWAESDLKNEEITFDSTSDLSGPLNIAIALKRGQPEPSRMVVFGSVTFAINGWFEQQLNGDLILNSVNWLIAEDEEILATRPREPRNRRINLTTAQARVINWLALRIIPFLSLITAVFFWSQHR